MTADDKGKSTAGGSSTAEDPELSIDDLIADQQHKLEGDAQKQYWVIIDPPLPATEVLAGQSVDQE